NTMVSGYKQSGQLLNLGSTTTCLSFMLTSAVHWLTLLYTADALNNWGVALHLKVLHVIW
ncbi:MAG: hypothetical protein ACPG5T_10060, partial [Endozoicomonas sp.]